MNNASREHEVSYSRFMQALAEQDIALNRKVLSELAMHEPQSFKALVNLAKKHHAESQKGLKLLL